MLGIDFAKIISIMPDLILKYSSIEKGEKCG